MIFLIDYDRGEGRVVTLRQFQDNERASAEGARLELELQQHRQAVQREVVLLEAEDLAALYRTHARYFKDVREQTADLRRSTGEYGMHRRKEFIVRERVIKGFFLQRSNDSRRLESVSLIT